MAKILRTFVLSSARAGVRGHSFSHTALVLTALAVLSLPLSSAAVTLSWQDNSANETGFQIERAATDLVFQRLATVARNVITYNDTTALASATYQYRVAAINSSGMSAYSNVATTGATLPPPPPPPPSNTSPTISALANQAILQGTTAGPITFTVGDAETNASALVVTATSSNPTLVPNITLGGSGTSRTLTLIPAASQTGTATITVTVSDGQLSAATGLQFTVTAPPPNTAPSISAIMGRTIDEDTSTGPLAFTVGDAETPASNLVVTASASNPTLFPPANIVLGGSGANRTVTLTPAPNQTGSATITLTVSDGALSRATTFTQTVYGLNDAPILSAIGNQTTNEDTATSPIGFVIGDVETAVTALTLTGASSNPTLLPVSGIVFGGSTANRTVTLLPAANQSGTAQVTISVRDGNGANAFRTFQLTVNAVNDAPTIGTIADQTTTEGVATAAIPFAIGDIETPAASLVITASSSNQTLLPTAGIVLGGAGAARTLTLAPAANQSGTATLTVTVSDGQLTASRTFALSVRPVNRPPTISSIADATVVSGILQIPITFAVADAITPSGSLTVSGSSSNQTLIPNSGLQFSGSGGTRVLTTNPSPGQTGTATITVTVSDGQLNASSTFQLTIIPNTAPTISSIASRTIDEDHPTGAMAFTVGDAETPAADLIVTAVSSNPTLFPSANIILEGSGANRTLSMTPAPNQTGSTHVTLTVSDGALSRSTTFTLTVYAINDAPTISSIANQSTIEDIPAGPIAFVIGDVETPAGSLTLTGASSNLSLLPIGGIVFGGSGANRTVTLIPAINQTGTTRVTITVRDGSSNSSSTFLLTVNPINAAPTISMIANQTTSANMPAAAISSRALPARVSILGPVDADSPLIAGFVVEGTIPREVLVRASGPSLAAFGVSPSLTAPHLVIYNAAGESVHESGTWADDAAITEASARSGYFPLAAGSADAAAIVTLPPGVYTAHVISSDGSQGTALLEIADAQPAGAAVFVQSARARLSQGGTLTAGVVVDGAAPQRLLLRGVGPELIQSAVADPLPDPQLVVRDQRGVELARSASPSAGGTVEDRTTADSDDRATLAPGVPAASDSAVGRGPISMIFAPGAYTITLRSERATDGTALIELISDASSREFDSAPPPVRQAQAFEPSP